MDGEPVTHAGLDAAARAVAAWLAPRITRGDRVLLAAGTSLGFLRCYLGTLRAGGVVVLANPGYTAAELGHLVSDSGAAIAFADLERSCRLAGLAQAPLIVPVAGTRWLDAASGPAPRGAPWRHRGARLHLGQHGWPKGVPLTHLELAASIQSAMAAWRWTAGDVLACALPLFHQHGLSGVHATLAAGSTAHLRSRPGPAGRSRSSGTPGRPCCSACLPPTWGCWTRPARRPGRCCAACGWRCAGRRRSARPWPPGWPRPPGASRWSATAPRSPGWTSPTRWMLPGRRPPGCRCPGSTAGSGRTRLLRVGARFPPGGGEVPPGGEAAPGTDGEIQVRGPQVFTGYWHDRAGTGQAFTADGWFRTGDIGTVDPASGHLVIRGRIKELIITGGMNVYPREVELALEAHPAVAEAAVAALPHPRWGEQVTAWVVLCPGHQFRPDGLIAHARTRLAAYKCPKEVFRLAELPRTPVGKLDRRALTFTPPAP